MWVIISNNTVIGLFTSLSDCYKLTKKLVSYSIFEVYPNSTKSKLYDKND